MNEIILKAFIEYMKEQRPSRPLIYDYQTNKFTDQRTQDMYEGYCAGVASNMGIVGVTSSPGKVQNCSVNS